MIVVMKKTYSHQGRRNGFLKGQPSRKNNIFLVNFEEHFQAK